MSSTEISLRVELNISLPSSSPALQTLKKWLNITRHLKKLAFVPNRLKLTNYLLILNTIQSSNVSLSDITSMLVAVCTKSFSDLPYQCTTLRTEQVETKFLEFGLVYSQWLLLMFSQRLLIFCLCKIRNLLEQSGGEIILAK